PLHRLARSSYGMNQQAFRRFSGDDHRAAISPFECAFPGIQAETALRLFRSMALEAGGFKYGANVPAEINGTRGLGRGCIVCLRPKKRRGKRGRKPQKNPVSETLVHNDNYELKHRFCRCSM